MTSMTLPAIVDVAAAGTLADSLRAMTGAIRIDGTAVERIGTAGVQVLLSAAATGEANGVPVVVTEASESLRSAITLSGALRLLPQSI